MVEAAHHVVLFLNLQWDDCNIFMRYDRHQSHPSPLGMCAYKSIDPSLVTFGSDVFINHKNMHVPDSLCFSSDCARQYKDIISLRKYTCNMSRAFSRLFECYGARINAKYKTSLMNTVVKGVNGLLFIHVQASTTSHS